MGTPAKSSYEEPPVNNSEILEIYGIANNPASSGENRTINNDRLVIVFKSFLLLMADSEEAFRKHGATVGSITGSAVSAVSGGGSVKVVVEGI